MSARLDLWLVRHGATAWNVAGRLVGWSDVGLSPAGMEQARRLRPILDRIGPASAWSSDLRRAIDTARLAGLEPRTDPRLREIHFGALEGRTWDRIGRPERDALVRFDGFRAPLGESVEDLRRRLLGFVEGLVEGRYVIVSHGGPLKVLLRLRGRRHDLRPGGVVQLTWPPVG